MTVTAEAASLDAASRARLLDRLRRLAMVSGRELRLASGRTSSVYFDMKLAMFDPETMSLIADAILDVAATRGAEQVGGLEMGAVPIVGAVACRSFPDRPLRGFFVRKTVKAHGTQKRIEGCFQPEAPTLLLEDVTTTGGSVLEALAAVREAGGEAKAVLTVVDREEGATEALAAAGVELVALFTKSDFGA
jgi:orotate phosphoribosyltransferase